MRKESFGRGARGRRQTFRVRGEARQIKRIRKSALSTKEGKISMKKLQISAADSGLLLPIKRFYALFLMQLTRELDT